MKKKFTHLIIGIILVFLSITLISCMTVGRKFPVEPVSKITISQTTQKDIQQMFGEPWRMGIEDGMKTWTYGDYHYSVFGGTTTTDLVVRFNADKTVASYTFNTTNPGYINK
ncbi:MAG: hypothetical protein MUP22_15260 [Desulfobacterales bacterium]|nr:hypothetical protein [Desulfobacterales bacterium]